MTMSKKIMFFVLIVFCLSGCSRKHRMADDARAFPWPPPVPSAFCKIPAELLKKTEGDTTLRDVLEKLEKTMEYAGYTERQLFSVKNGFAVSTKIEQFQEDGTPEKGEKRWDVEMSPLPVSILVTNPKKYRNALFYPDVYRFRRIVFVVKPGELIDNKTPITPAEAKQWFSSSLQGRFKNDIIDIQYSQHYTCTALVYEFEKYKINEQTIHVENSKLPGKTHLEKTKLWQALEMK